MTLATNFDFVGITTSFTGANAAYFGVSDASLIDMAALSTAALDDTLVFSDPNSFFAAGDGISSDAIDVAAAAERSVEALAKLVAGAVEAEKAMRGPARFGGYSHAAAFTVFSLSRVPAEKFLTGFSLVGEKGRDEVPALRVKRPRGCSGGTCPSVQAPTSDVITRMEKIVNAEERERIEWVNGIVEANRDNPGFTKAFGVHMEGMPPNLMDKDGQRAGFIEFLVDEFGIEFDEHGIPTRESIEAAIQCVMEDDIPEAQSDVSHPERWREAAVAQVVSAISRFPSKPEGMGDDEWNDFLGTCTLVAFERALRILRCLNGK